MSFERSASPFDSRYGLGAAPGEYPEEILPFSVRLVRTEADLHQAVRIRQSAYARHLPEFAETLKRPEAADTEPGTVVFLAESKLDGSPLGTMRIQTNEFKPLTLEQSITLPDWLQGRRLAEATRLGVTDGKGGRLVTTVLFKTYYQYCKKINMDWMVIAGRSPIDRQYSRMLFEDVFEGMGFIPLAHASNLPHRVMQSNVSTAEARWIAAKHPLFDFAFRTYHPDIDLGLAVSKPMGKPASAVQMSVPGSVQGPVPGPVQNPKTPERHPLHHSLSTFTGHSTPFAL